MVFPFVAALPLPCKLKVPAAGVLRAVIVPYFLCTTGVLGLFWQYPRSAMLNASGVQYDSNITFDQEVSAARWIQNVRDTRLQVSEFGMQRRLVSYAELTENQNHIFRATEFINNQGSYTGYVIMDYLHMSALSVSPGDFLERLGENDKVYDNGGLEIYRLLR